MENDLQITIGTTEALVGIGVIVFAIGAAWARVIFTMSGVKETLDKIQPDLQDMRERFGGVESKVEVLWRDKYAPASSPRQLNAEGKNILKESGIKDVIDEKQEELLELIRQDGPETAYDAEVAIFDFMEEEFLERYPEYDDQLKNGAFRAGAEIEAVLFVGGIYLRNLIFPKLGFSFNDSDLY